MPQSQILAQSADGTTCAALISEIDVFLAASLRGEAPYIPWGRIDPMFVAKRTVYHGVAALLLSIGIDGWPQDARAAVHEQALGQTMWELRHKTVVGACIEALAAAGVRSILLKGTAFAYDIYEVPAHRSRGDSDLLISADCLGLTRDVLIAAGYARTSADTKWQEDLQEMWFTTHPDGSRHELDVHWQVVDAPALDNILPVDECFANAIALPALSPNAYGLSHPQALIHSCVHRAKHLSSPYYSGSDVHYSPDRLIWSCDMDRLALRLDVDGWARFASLAIAYDVAAICLDGLAAAQRDMHTDIPPSILAALQAAPQDTPSARYLGQGNALRRGLVNMAAVPGWRGKLLYALRRLFPGHEYVRIKYPEMLDAPIAKLYLRRILEAGRRKVR